MSTSVLYIILPYFNFINYRSGEKNLKIFIENSKKYSNTKLVLVEAVHPKGLALPDYSGSIFKHVKLKARDILWIKENLINIGIQNLPEDWEYVAWVDRDIEFEDNNWAVDCMEKLQYCDAVQPWKECIYLNKDGKAENDEFFYKNNNKNTKVFSQCYVDKQNISSQNYYPHHGHAWACTKNFYKKIGGLYDKAIIGSGDSLLLVSKKKWHERCPTLYLRDELANFLEETEKIKTNYLSGKIYHHFHGRVLNRQYHNRHEILQDFNYKPKLHVYYNTDGVLEFTNEGKPLEKYLEDFFIKRTEDDCS
jgi:hypothetical protein